MSAKKKSLKFKKAAKFTLTVKEGDDIDKAIESAANLWKALVTSKIRYLGFDAPLRFSMQVHPADGKTFRIKPKPSAKPTTKKKKEKR